MRNAAQDFGYNFVRPAYKHAAVYADILAFYVAEVIQRCLAHGCPAQIYRFNLCKRRKLPRPAHLPADRPDGSFCLLCLEFICHSPAGKLVCIAYRLACGAIVQLDYRTVGEDIYVLPFHLYLLYCGNYLLIGRAELKEGIDLEAVAAQKFKVLHLRFKPAFRHIIYVVEEYFGVSFRSDLWVKIPDSACGGIACIFKLFPCGTVVFLQHRKSYYCLSLHLERTLVVYREREAPYGQTLRRDVLALHTVSAGSRADKFSAFISKAHCKPVELIFYRELRVRNDLSYPCQKGAEHFIRDGLVKAVKPVNVSMPVESLDGLAANPSRRAVKFDVSALPLYLRQFVVQPVIFPVRHAGIVQNVVFVRPSVQSIYQIPDSVFHLSISSGASDADSSFIPWFSNATSITDPPFFNDITVPCPNLGCFTFIPTE